MPARGLSGREILDLVILGASVVCLLVAITREIINRDRS